MKSVLVTGGGGFVGSAVVRLLVDQGCRVRVAGRRRYPEIERIGAECAVGDIGEEEFVNSACRGVDTVFHVAAKAGIWGPWPDYYKTNVAATRYVVAACRRHGVRRLVYTSTPSVVFSGTDIINGTEKLPYATRFLCHYARSKATAEHHVLQSNDNDLKTCAIRPHLIWGPGDPHLIPRLIERGRAGSLKIIGSGTNLVDISYIDNVARAHILAAQCLERSDKAAGQAYFIGQERPVNLWGWINELYRSLGIPELDTRIPLPFAYFIGAVCEMVYKLAARGEEPRMTRFLAQQLAHSHYFSHGKAEQDLGYKPVVSLADGQERLINWAKTL